MEARKRRLLQLNLGLAVPTPTEITSEKDEELIRAIVDLLIEALSTTDEVSENERRSRHERKDHA